MISIARTFGAPVTVPAGKHARNTSIAESPSRSRPSTWLTMCMTWEYRSTTMRSGTVTEPYSATRPTSLRPRSTSIRCSASSFSSASSSSASPRSSSGVRPRGRVPAMGRTVTMPSSTRTRTSGELPTRETPSSSRKYRYGEGFRLRSARYRSKGEARSSKASRWLSTIWKASPARTYSRMRSTPRSKPSREIELAKGGSRSGSGRRAIGGGGCFSPRSRTTRSVLSAASSYREASSSPESPGSTATAAIAIALPRRLSMTRTMSVKTKSPSGSPRSSGGGSGRRSIWRTTSYPKYPTAPPQNGGRPSTSAGSRARSRASRSPSGSSVSTSVQPASGDHQLTLPRCSFQAPVGFVPRKE